MAIRLFLSAAAVASEDTLRHGGTDTQSAATFEASSVLRLESLKAERSGRSPHGCYVRTVGFGMLPILIEA